MRYYQFIILLCGLLWYGLGNGYAQAKRIAIMELENKSNRMVSNAEVSSLTSTIRMILSYLPKNQFSIMTQENIEVMLPPDMVLEDCVGSCAIETGRLLNAHWIISGHVIKFGSQLKSTIKLHDTQSGSYITGIQFKGKSIDDLEKPLLVGSLKLLYEIYPKFKHLLVDKTKSKDIKKHLVCLLDESRCRQIKPKRSLPKNNLSKHSREHSVNRVSTRKTNREAKQEKSKTSKISSKDTKPKVGIFESLRNSVSKLTRIKLDKRNKQRIVFFDLKAGVFNHLGETNSSTKLLREVGRKLNKDYFLVISKKSMLQKLPPHSDMQCKHHGYCMTLGRKLGAYWIFAGDLIRLGNSLQLFLRLYDVKTGFIRASEVLKGESVSDLEALLTPALLLKMFNMKE
jgi:hypothetical protein